MTKMDDLSIYDQIESTLEVLRKDFVESRNLHLIIAVISITTSMVIFIYLFWSSRSLNDEIVSPIATGACGAISFPIWYQLKEFIRDRRKLNLIRNMQTQVKVYQTTKAPGAKKFFEGSFIELLKECLN